MKISDFDDNFERLMRRGGIGTLADVRRIEQIPLAERNLPATTFEVIEKSAAKTPDAAALRFFLRGGDFKNSVSFSYVELLGEIRRAANLFARLGIGENDTVSIILPNLPETHFAVWAAQAVGMGNPINPLLEPAAIIDIMNAAESRVLVTLAAVPKSDLWEKIEIVRRAVPSLETVVAVRLEKYLKPLEKLFVKIRRVGTAKRFAKQKLLDYHGAVKREDSGKLDFTPNLSGERISAVYHTGGTTGTPKLAQITHFNQVFSVWAAAQNREPNAVGAGKTMFTGLPLFHTNAVLIGALLPWMFGGTVLLGTAQGFRDRGVIGNFWRIVEHYRVSAMSGVPTVYQMLLETPMGGANIESLDFAVCGAASLPVELLRRFESVTGVEIMEGYGMTEGANTSSINPGAGAKRSGSVGLRLPYQELKIAEIENGEFKRDYATDEIGTVLIRGANVFAGYKNPEHDRAAWTIDEAGSRWFITGDLGRLDADGYLWLAGRSKEIIIRGGHNIDPATIENALLEHPAVALAAAVGRPHARLGEIPAAYVQLHAGAAATSLELLERLRQNIRERAALPERIVLIDEMPLTAVGKIYKPKLIQLETADALASALRETEKFAAVNVAVEPHSTFGIFARVSIEVSSAAADGQKIARQTLDLYNVRYELNAEITPINN